MNSDCRSCHKHVRIPFLILFSVCSFFSEIGQAQVIPPITASGLNTQISAPLDQGGGVTQYNITAGTRPGGGENLFHSFGEFGVPTNNIANFLNDSGLPTINILSRVTGGTPSNILGTIQTEGFGNANLFLMNPAGIVFGQSASLNVGGATHFTTADYLRLSDGVQFTALPSAQDSLLSIAPVAAFGFLSSNPGSISVEGSTLSVKEGQTLSLIGGDMTIGSSSLTAQGGKIAMASVASAGEILASTLDQAPNINNQSFGTLGTIQISEKSVIDASGDGDGTVLIRGGRLVVDNSTISANTTGQTIGQPMDNSGAGIEIQISQDVVIQNDAIIETNVLENAAPGIGSGGVRVKAGRIEIVGFSQDFDNLPFTGIRSNVAAGSAGDASGDILLEADAILIKDFFGGITGLRTETQGAGSAGNIILRTTGDVDIDNGNLRSVSSFGGGNSGNVELTSTQGNIIIRDTSGSSGPFVTSQATRSSNGSVGGITMNAPEGDILVTDFASLFSSINGTGGIEGGGGIQLSGKNLVVSNDSSIQVDNFLPLVPGGITVNVSGRLSLSGTSNIATTTRGPGRSSDLNITAPDILVTGDSFLSAETFGSGDAGAINVLTENIQLTNGGQLRSSSTIGRAPPGQEPPIPSGSGGTIIIQGLASPAGSIVIDGAGSGIFTDAQGTGAAGSITLTGAQFTVTSGGRIQANTSSQGAGGTINIVTTEDITVSGMSSDGQTRSGMFSQSSGTDPGSGAGGAISLIADQNFTLSDGATVSASSDGPGNAGDITVTAGDTILIDKAIVTTEAALATGGNIKLTASDTIQLTDSTIASSVEGDENTKGGNINLDPDFITLQNSQILAKAGKGKGGNIDLVANDVVLVDSFSEINATASEGISGSVTIQAPVQFLSGTIAPLPQNPAPVTALYGTRCVADEGGHFSTFVDSKVDSLAPPPGTFLASPFLPLSSVSHAGSVNHTETSSAIPEKVHATPLQLAAYSPPVLFSQNDDVSSACP